MRARQLATTAMCRLLILGLLTACASAKKTSDVQPLGGTSSTPAASASSSPTPVPASPFEDDPAVKALRAWATQLSHTINTGKYDDSALDTLMTAEVKASMRNIAGGEVGHYEPGPLPFSPLSLTASTATEHTYRICMVGSGFAQDPNTHKPAEAYKAVPINAGATSVDGRWLVSGFHNADFSCDGVKIPMPTW